MRVRMGMSVADGEQLAATFMHCDADPAIRDAYAEQLWLRTVFVEQRRRTRIAEREAFDLRADRILSAFDPD